MSTYEARSKLVKGVAVSVVEKNERGDIVGAYTGYWNPDRRKVTLYPDYRHPALKAGIKLSKKEIYDGHVKVRSAGVSSSSTASGPPSTVLGKANPGVPNATRQIRNLPIIGQTRMKF